ncbi:MAG: peptidoglycan-binding protein [Bacteroidetes bacterium]|nr:peptidoglycan-binding protein [Bacteroidota bacterium]
MKYCIRGLMSLILCFVIFGFVSAHSGRTDKYGGHNNRKTGGYHYHNAGRVHAASNSYQNHKTCGICASSKSKKEKSTSKVKITDKQTIMALQAGLKCMGYQISEIDGKIGPETKSAIAKFAKAHNTK